MSTLEFPPRNKREKIARAALRDYMGDFQISSEDLRALLAAYIDGVAPVFNLKKLADAVQAHMESNQ